ncbi:MAG: hypothetical protein EOR77_21435 [Mesorhizobium sp.]|uniref:hypothetical protein n=1 Tax=Mesorhizobium sp. TaxID=1871066 RepID=UPI000FE555B4|nr:hypothetical protein [Mesorhizobium sp.]RWM32596.1 MAG: hypothetical protein EOR77_21435 [Mesorhizobium sp.]
MFPSYMRPAEQKIVRALIKKALGLGYLVSVYDGEEWAVKKSGDYEKITAEIAATDETQLIFRKAEDGSKVGWLMLVHGNDEDVICDHTANDAMDQLVEGVDA